MTRPTLASRLESLGYGRPGVDIDETLHRVLDEVELSRAAWADGCEHVVTRGLDGEVVDKGDSLAELWSRNKERADIDELVFDVRRKEQP